MIIKPLSLGFHDLVGSEFYVVTGREIRISEVPPNQSVVELDRKTIDGIVYIELQSRLCLELDNDGAFYLRAPISEVVRNPRKTYYLCGGNLTPELKKYFPGSKGDCSVLVFPKIIRGICQKEIDLGIGKNIQKNAKEYPGRGGEFFTYLMEDSQ